MADSLLQQYGPRALVTGASSGIGEAFARQLAAEGFELVLVARRAERLQALADELAQQYGSTVQVLAADLSEADQLTRLVAELNQRPVNLLVSNAGFGLKGGFAEDELPRILDMIHTNAIAPVMLLHALLPTMAAAGRGGVIVTGSIEGETGFPWSAAYAATKAFVHNLGGSLWDEYRGSGVDVLVLSPGSTDTDAPRLQGISDDQLVGVMPPERVAREALAQLGKRPLWIPGWHNRLFIRLLRLLPRSLALRAAGAGMKRAIDNSKRRGQSSHV